MATFRENPYGAFNYIVNLQGDTDGQEGDFVGAFSDVSGLGTEIQYAEYRNGNEAPNTVRKIQNTFTNEDVTLKRGLVGSTDLFDWWEAVSRGEIDPRNVRIQLLDEAKNAVATWTLRKAQIKKWTGPTLAAKGGTEVAMEEIVLCHEGLDYA